MKTFKDLNFVPHPNRFMGFGEVARLNFDNGYGISVITGNEGSGFAFNGVYGDSEHPYEVAVLWNGELTYETPITDDVIGYQTEADVEDLMRQIQELPEKKAA